MNYAYLGDRLSQSAAENFPVFLADLCARADAAYITPSTRSLLEDREPGEYEFPSSQALLEYATHRLLWSWYRRDRDAQSPRRTRRPTSPDTDDDRRDDDDTDDEPAIDDRRIPIIAGSPTDAMLIGNTASDRFFPSAHRFVRLGTSTMVVPADARPAAGAASVSSCAVARRKTSMIDR